MANQTFDENTTMDASAESEDLAAALRTMSALTFVEVAASWILNAIVIRALLDIADLKLKVRFLLINAVASDILLAGVLALRDALELAGSDEISGTLTNPVVYIRHVIYDSLAYFSTFYQIFASVAVAFDRFYSIYGPLNYHTTSYSSVKKMVILTGVFGVAFGLSLPVLMSKLNPRDDFHQLALEESAYSEEILPGVLIGSVILTLSIYAAIFVMVIYHRRKSQAMTSRNTNQTARNRQVSLSKTFFLINITYVVLYVPGAIYHMIRSDNLKGRPILDYYLEQVTILIYLGNTLVDPLIYISRVRSIRELVRRNGFCCSRTKTRQDTDVKSEVSTVSTLTPGPPAVSLSTF